MKVNKLISVWLAAVLLMGAIPMTVFAEADPLATLGGGTEESPYIIDSVDDWQTVSALTDYSNIGKYFKLGADIGTADGDPIALGSLFSSTLVGLNFDGNEKTVQNVTFTAGALLAPITDSCTVKDLTVKNATRIGTGESTQSGVLIGRADGTNVLTDVSVEASSVFGVTSTGILIGEVNWGAATLTDCSVTDCTVQLSHTGWQEGMGALLGKANKSEMLFTNCTVNGISFIGSDGAPYSDARVGVLLGKVDPGNTGKQTKFIGCVIDCGTTDVSTMSKVGNGSVAELDVAVINIPGVTDPFASLGKGTMAEPYVIDSVEDWQLVHNTASYVGAGARFQLGADIGTESGEPIKLGALFTSALDGLRFDGNGRTVQNVIFTDGALIAPASNNCTVSNLTLKNVMYTGDGTNDYGAILLGKAAGSTVLTNITVEESLAGGKTSMGILIGEISYGTATVTGCDVNGCTVKKAHDGWQEGMGALAGKVNYSTATLTDCRAERISLVDSNGNTYTDARVGLLVGNNAGSAVTVSESVVDCGSDTAGTMAARALIGKGDIIAENVTVLNGRRVKLQTTAPDGNNNFKIRCYIYSTEAEKDAQFNASIKKDSDTLASGVCESADFLWGYEGVVQSLYAPSAEGGTAYRYFTATDVCTAAATYEVEFRYTVSGITYLVQGVAELSETGTLTNAYVQP